MIDDLTHNITPHLQYSRPQSIFICGSDLSSSLLLPSNS